MNKNKAIKENLGGHVDKKLAPLEATQANVSGKTITSKKKSRRLLTGRAKIGKFKTVFKGEVYEIKQANAVLPSGKKTKYEMMLRGPSVMILPIDSKGRLLLIREYRYRTGGYVYALPAGRAKKNESGAKAAQRELQEETGFRAKKLTLLHEAKGGQSWVWKRYAYIAEGLELKPLKGDEDEDITVMPVSLGTAFNMVKQNKIWNENMAYMIARLFWSTRKSN